MPLGAVKSAAVFIDRTAPGADTAETAVREFFSGRGITVTVLAPDSGQLNCAGFMKRPFRQPGGQERSEDLFISLSCRPDDFASEFEARCSPARFKAGCVGLGGDVFDLTVSLPDGVSMDQAGVFGAIKDYLLKIE